MKTFTEDKDDIPEALMPVVEELVKQYKKALTISYVDKPIAYAVYQTCKTFNSKGGKRLE